MTIDCPQGINGTIDTVNYILYHHDEKKVFLLVMAGIVSAAFLSGVNFSFHLCFLRSRYSWIHMLINGLSWILILTLLIVGIQRNQGPATVICDDCNVFNSSSVCDNEPFVPVQKRAAATGDFVFNYNLVLKYRKESSDPYSFVPDFTNTFDTSDVDFIKASDLLINHTPCYCYDDTASLRGDFGNDKATAAFYISFGVIGLGYLYAATLYFIGIMLRYGHRYEYIGI